MSMGDKEDRARGVSDRILAGAPPERRPETPQSQPPAFPAPEKPREIIEDYESGLRVLVRGASTVEVDLLYPKRNDSDDSTHPQFVEVGIECVRAADSIRIHYDFERDGYVVEQASTFEWPMDDGVCDPDWQEVAFVQAWAREKPSADE